MRGCDLDGVVTHGYQPAPGEIIISGRTWAEYDLYARAIAHERPLYILGKGAYGDWVAAAAWKACIIAFMQIEVFTEDDPNQAAMIRDLCPECRVEMYP